MNLQERELLTTFLQQMSQAQAGQKDAEADRLIREAVARQPDAAYLLVQRAMGLEYGLQTAQAQVAKLQAELDQLRSNAPSGFLDSPNSWGRTASAPAQAPLVPAQASVQQAQAAAKPASSWGSGMLGTVATTAAGVVAGSFLFQGIQGLMGHHNAAANETPLPPVSKESPLDNDDVADALDDSTDSAALDGGDFDSGNLT
jgi:hypothetical protein